MSFKRKVKTASQPLQSGSRISETAWNGSCLRYQIGASASKSETCADFSEKASPNSRQNVPPLSDAQPAPERKKMSSQHRTRGRDINGYLPARLVEGTKWYIEFYSFDPDADSLRRKRMYIPSISPKSARRSYAQEMILNVNSRLVQGWNPFLRLSDPKEYAQFEDVCETYCRYLFQLAKDGIQRVKTYNGYTSYLNIFRKWNRERPKPVTFAYQLKASVIDEFLDWVWVDRGKSVRTRDNYLTWIRTFTKWMVEKGYITEDPAAGIRMIRGHRKAEKNRTVIPKDAMLRLRAYLEEHDRNFLLACYILYYCYVRPKEMSDLKLENISVMKGTIFIPAAVSKNKKDAVVTIPDHVMHLMIDLKVLEHPNGWFLFSFDCRPGPEHRLPKYFCDMWKKVATALKFPAEWKFYSLKDTGITDQIRAGRDLIEVRDQARHYSLEQTDIYTPIAGKDGNRELRKYEGYF